MSLTMSRARIVLATFGLRDKRLYLSPREVRYFLGTRHGYLPLQVLFVFYHQNISWNFLSLTLGRIEEFKQC